MTNKKVFLNDHLNTKHYIHGQSLGLYLPPSLLHTTELIWNEIKYLKCYIFSKNIYLAAVFIMKNTVFEC